MVAPAFADHRIGNGDFGALVYGKINGIVMRKLCCLRVYLGKVGFFDYFGRNIFEKKAVLSG